MAAAIDPDPLETPIFTDNPLPHPLQQALISRLWPMSDLKSFEFSDDTFQTYITHLQREFSPAYATHHAIQSFSDLLLLLDTLRTKTNFTLAQLQEHIKNDQQSKFESYTQTQISTSIELAVRVWLMVSVRITMPSHRRLLETSLPWPENLTLVEVLQRHLSQPSPTPASGIGRFSDYLNVVDMKKVANIRVLWTNNLGEHLTMQGRNLYLFQHVAALKQLMASEASNPFIPPSLLTETLLTLNLLIPTENPQCNAWLQEEITRYQLDPSLLYRATATRNKADFIFWQERLSSLSEYFDMTKPSSLAQWWHDRRDMGQWWNYWLVVAGISLTVFFGLVQSVTGIIQAATPSSP